MANKGPNDSAFLTRETDSRFHLGSRVAAKETQSHGSSFEKLSGTAIVRDHLNRDGIG